MPVMQLLFVALVLLFDEGNRQWAISALTQRNGDLAETSRTAALASTHLETNSTCFLQALFDMHGHDGVLTMDDILLLMCHITSGNCEDEKEVGEDHCAIYLANTLKFKSPKIEDSKCCQQGCLNASSIFPIFGINHEQKNISRSTFLQLCPAIVYQMGHEHCIRKKHTNPRSTSHDKVMDDSHTSDARHAWLFASCGVLFISMMGMLGVVSIPLLQKLFYKQILQFLVALAVGALSGDALLHLLPHALATPTPDDHGHDGEHNAAIWKGLTALSGMYSFFILERFIRIFRFWRQESQSTNQARVVEPIHGVGEKLSKHRYSSNGYAYDEVPLDVLQGLKDDINEEQRLHSPLNSACSGAGNYDIEAKVGGCSKCKLEPVDLQLKPLVEEQSHCNSHGHHHSLSGSLPDTFAAVVWMVVIGDGIHNFTDGLAIGASFSYSLSGGLSTCIAVLCHELPHELGDFAMLLKSGFTVRQALLCNCVSSVLCFVGMASGMVLGNIALTSTYIFAGASGMFLYLSLVDMMPELHLDFTTKSDMILTLILYLVGLSCGITIMLVIALYEHDLKKILPS